MKTQRWIIKGIKALSLIPLLFVTMTTESRSQVIEARELESIAQKYQGLFHSELRDKGVLDKEFVVRAHIDPDSFTSARFEDDRQSVQIDGITEFDINQITLRESCKTTGSAAGTTAGGAKVTYSKRSCQMLILHDHSKFVPGAECKQVGSIKSCSLTKIRFPISAADFRFMQKTGLDIEVRFRLVSSKGPVFEAFEGGRKATFNRPVELSTKGWDIAGEISEVRWFLSGRKEAIRTDTAQTVTK